MSDIAIRVENVSKYYRLGVINNGTLFKDIQTWFALKRGKDDPNGIIGDRQDFLNGKDGFWALKNLNFDIKKGDRVGIIGHNGAGKSTLLKILSGITTPTEGTIKINGRISSLLEVGTGFHSELTGRENIYLNGSILGMKKREVDRKIDEIIAFSEIGDHIDTPVKRYSSGMYVRLAFAVAAHLDSDILIADEVLAVGDASFQKKALGKMNELSTGEGRTVLFVSHNMSQIKNLCNRGIVLEKGMAVRQDNDIKQCIDYYLGKNDTKKTYEWPYREGLGNMYFRPTRFCLFDKNNSVPTVITKGCTYKVHLEFEVEQYNPCVEFVSLIKSNDDVIFALTSTEGNASVNEGKNTFEFEVPDFCLKTRNELTFLLEAVRKDDLSWIINPHENEVFFSIEISDLCIEKPALVKVQ